MTNDDTVSRVLTSLEAGARLRLIHRTTDEAARAVVAAGHFGQGKEAGGWVYASTQAHGQAIGHGPAVVLLEVAERHAELDDEFPDGEQHYRLRPVHAQVVCAILSDGTVRRVQ